MERTDDGEVVQLRRSQRTKRVRSEWHEEIVMTVRRSRASGIGDTVECANLGGRPTHKKKRSQNKSKQIPKPSGKFCEKCGVKFCSDDAKFCRQCGTKRPFVSEDAPEVASVDLTVSPAASKPTKASGRPRTKRLLRCGWTVVSKDGSQTFIAPNGKEFGAREEAAKYKNAAVPRLEPARKDGWQVFMNQLRTHTNWIAPDGQKLQSYLQAKAYSKSAKLPIYGSDGITQNISKFFSSKSKSNSNNAQPSRPTRPARPTQSVQTKQSVSQTKEKSKQRDAEPKKINARVFSVPAQTAKGKALMNLCRKASIARRRRRHKNVAKVELEIVNGYTSPRKISDNMANKVLRVVVLRICVLNVVLRIYLLTQYNLHSLAQICNALLQQLFCYGNTLDVLEVFHRMMTKPATRYLQEIGSDCTQSTQVRETIDAIMKNVTNYLTTILQTKGTRQTIEQQAYRTVVAACAGPNLRENRLMDSASRVLVSKLCNWYILF